MRKHPSAAKRDDFAQQRIAMKDTGIDKPPRLRRWLIGIVIAAVLAVGGVAYHKRANAQTSSVAMLSARTTTGGCTALNASQFNALRVFHANGSTSAGSGAAVIEIRAGMTSSNVNVVLGTITLTLSTSATAAAGNGGFASQANWPYLCANVNSISGTGASVNANVGAN